MVALAYFGMEHFMGGAQGLALFVAGALGFVGGAFKGVEFESDNRTSDERDLTSRWYRGL